MEFSSNAMQKLSENNISKIHLAQDADIASRYSCKHLNAAAARPALRDTCSGRRRECRIRAFKMLPHCLNFDYIFFPFFLQRREFQR
ncbi:hypothetical protein EVAR_92069_1 [Eumeta japonica]|uniref:Uncharacterized protein n=1 Tax=Eumeta variegata TaxID=151549 RepID=A0A4C1SY32_EUMVA|nr:hypothetical protein EVAR_92069_1 [Eumeta japonica]